MSTFLDLQAAVIITLSYYVAYYQRIILARILYMVWLLDELGRLVLYCGRAGTHWLGCRTDPDVNT